MWDFSSLFIATFISPIHHCSQNLAHSGISSHINHTTHSTRISLQTVPSKLILFFHLKIISESLSLKIIHFFIFPTLLHEFGVSALFYEVPVLQA